MGPVVLVVQMGLMAPEAFLPLKSLRDKKTSIY
jgi:hypothetical protein